ncbi:MAG TPA: hypothetical protein VGQ65_05885 [Thermoanaerobaculia bacterium]|nr:hypothetical protein [Thermoanaerobaculia bacterium]
MSGANSNGGVGSGEWGVAKSALSSTPHSLLPTPSDRVLIRRLLVIAAAIFVIVAAASRLELLYSHKFFDNTGTAQWIWQQNRFADGNPAAFFATYEFDLPPNRTFTRIKVLGDPEYTLYFNGVAVGGRHVGDDNEALDTYDVSALARDKKNRMVVALRSANGVGGLIASIDLTQEFGNFVVTGKDWHIVRRLRDDLLLRDPPSNELARPQLLGRPPARRWNYLVQRDAKPFAPEQEAIVPRERFDFETALPEIVVIGGTAVTVSRKTHATAYDFGPVSGRARLTILDVANSARNVTVRFANDRRELFTVEGSIEQVVFAAGERIILDEDSRNFRYVTVYGSAASVDVVR